MERKVIEFEDFLPAMAEKLGAEAFLRELSNGFQLLCDRSTGLITFASLKKNAQVLGLRGFSDGELQGMLREGDLDGDGALNRLEFCILMFRLSPGLMEESRRWLENGLQQELQGFMG